MKHGFLADDATIVSVANTGQTLKELDIDDLSLKKVAEKGKKGASMTMHQSARDSCVLDGFIEVGIDVLVMKEI
jgi:hypothetical protein